MHDFCSQWWTNKFSLLKNGTGRVCRLMKSKDLSNDILLIHDILQLTNYGVIGMNYSWKRKFDRLFKFYYRFLVISFIQQIDSTASYDLQKMHFLTAVSQRKNNLNDLIPAVYESNWTFTIQKLCCSSEILGLKFLSSKHANGLQKNTPSRRIMRLMPYE